MSVCTLPYLASIAALDAKAFSFWDSLVGQIADLYCALGLYPLGLCSSQNAFKRSS